MKSIYFYDNTYVRTLFFPIDTIILNDKDGNPVTLTKTGIAWESDKKYKFQNPTVPDNMTLKECKETPKSYLLYLFLEFLFMGHSTTTWSKLYPIFAPFEWTKLDILLPTLCHVTFPAPWTFC
jgi:hypothetical protein